MNIIVVDDHEIVREGMVKILSHQADIKVTASVSSVNDLFEKLKEVEADLIILDISLPGKSGLDTIKDIKLMYNDIKILMFSIFPDEKFAIRAIKMGADGYINKNSSTAEILLAVRKIIKGGKYLKSELVDELLINPEKAGSPNPAELLSDREFEVLRLIAEGLKAGQIAEKLNLSVNTIASYKARIQEKLNLKTTAELTRYAIENNLVE